MLSPSGRYLAWAGALPKGGHGLFVHDLRGEEKTRVLVAYKDIEVVSVRWTSDERLVYDIGEGYEADNDRTLGSGLFTIERSGGPERQLIKTRWTEESSGVSITDRRLSPAHQLLFAPENGRNEVIVGEHRFTDNGAFVGLFIKRLNLLSGQTESLSMGLPAYVDSGLFDADGLPRVVSTQHAGRRVHYWRDSVGDPWRKFGEFDEEHVVWWPRRLTADGVLYVTRNEGSASTSVLARFNFATGQPEAVPLVSTPGFDFNGDIVSEKPGAKALGVRTTTDAETTVWFDAKLKALQADIDTRLPGRVNRLDCRLCGTADMTVLVQSWSDKDPGEIWLWQAPPEGSAAGTSGLKLLLRQLKDIEPRRMGQLDLQRIRARDGLDLPVWVTKPAAEFAAPAGKRPAVVMVHGGPFVRGVYWQWDATAQFLASRGYVVIEPEFRGSAGYGATLRVAGYKQWGQKMQDDVADATRWAVGNAGVDANRICIIGASYGGYATLMGLIRDPALYRCGIAWAAVSDPRLMFDWSTAGDLPDDWRRYGLRLRLGDPVKDKDMLAANAPALHADKILAPLLLAHGGVDRRVPLEHATRMRDALKAAGKPPQWVLYDDEGHGWNRVDNSVDFAKRMERFLAENLR